MAVTLYASNTLSTTGSSTEDFLSSPNVAGSFVLYLDLVDMAAGDIIEVRAYKMVRTGGTQRVLFYTMYSGAQPTDGLIVQSEAVPNTLTDANAVRFSVKQTAGTAGISIPWAVLNIEDFPTNFTLFSIDGNGRIDVIKVAGTTQTAGDIIGDTNDIQTRLPAALVGGRMDSSVGAVAAGVDFSATMKSSINAEVLDVLNVDTFTEIGQETPAATQTIRKMLGYLYKAWRNRSTQTATAYSLYADDGTTLDQKSTVSDNGTTYDSGEKTTGP